MRLHHRGITLLLARLGFVVGAMMFMFIPFFLPEDTQPSFPRHRRRLPPVTGSLSPNSTTIATTATEFIPVTTETTSNATITTSELSDNPFIKYQNRPKTDWHDRPYMRAQARRRGIGENCVPVQLPDDEATRNKSLEMHRPHGFNAYVSSLISLDRAIHDIRHLDCNFQLYFDQLPNVSVIIPMYNEHLHTLLRTIHSTLSRSPYELLVEVIVVDDGSTFEDLKKPLEDHIKEYALEELVKVIRHPTKEGLIRAKQSGARAARGEVFLDSHSEPGYNWLPPLLDPIVTDYKTVVCPLIDIIKCDTFDIQHQNDGARGAFNWALNYRMLPLIGPRPDPSAPYDSPVMAGGYFAISKKWYWELGGYDEGLLIWGGEQYELSFKIWQCHGRMIDAPCSRVGHIYRCKPFEKNKKNSTNFVSRNYKRVAMVWMDEYAEHLYQRKPDMVKIDAGNLTQQLAVRERLKCHSFKWYLEKVAPDLLRYYPPVEPPDGASGLIRSLANSTYCIDVNGKDKGDRVAVAACGHKSSQNFRLSYVEDISLKSSERHRCFDASVAKAHSHVVLWPCRYHVSIEDAHTERSNQVFHYLNATSQMYHPRTKLCLQVDLTTSELWMESCDPDILAQKWSWDHVDWEVMNGWRNTTFN